MRRASRAAIAVALGLVVLKGWAWHVTGAAAMLATLTDSALDLLASSVNAWAIHHALTPPDREHRYGHGKLECLAGLGQSLLVGSSAAVLLWHAAEQLGAPAQVNHGALGVAVSATAIVATLALVRLQRRAIAASRSVAIAADSLHYQGDIALNLGVMVGIAGASWGGLGWLDGGVTALVAVWIGKGALDIGRASLAGLLDAEVDDATRAELLATAAAHPRVTGVHDLRTRRSGPFLFATLHLELDGNLSLRKAHDIGQEVDQALRAAFPAGRFMLHVDPDDQPPEDPFGDLLSAP